MHNLFLTIVGFHLLVVFLPVSMLILFRWPNAWHYMLALFLGLLIGYIDLHSDEVQLPALLLLVFGFFIAFSQPKSAWQFALLLAMWIPVGGCIRLFVENKTEGIVQQGLFSLLAFIPAFMGTYAGVAVRWAVAHFSPEAANTGQ